MPYEAEAVSSAGPAPEKIPTTESAPQEPKKYEWFQEPEVVYSDVDTVRLYYPDVKKYMSVTFDFRSNEDHTKFLQSERTSMDFIKHNGYIYYHEPYDSEEAKQEGVKGDEPANRFTAGTTNDKELERMLGLSTNRIRRGARIAKDVYFKDKYTPSIMDSLQDTIADIERVLAEPPSLPLQEVKEKIDPVTFVPPTPESPYLPEEKNETRNDTNSSFGPDVWNRF